MVRQVKNIKEREVDSEEDEEKGAGDFDAEMEARLEILRFLREKMEEAIEKIQEIVGDSTRTQYVRGKLVQTANKGDDFIAKPVGIFSLISGADYITNLELTSMWTLGLEIVYSIEKKPKFCWSGLVVFLLGVAQLVGGVLLTVFTVEAAASIGMGLIAEGISDCISGIEGMVTGEFSWTEWAIAKATGLALSLISGGVSRLATTGFKALKMGYKIAKIGRKPYQKLLKTALDQLPKQT